MSKIINLQEKDGAIYLKSYTLTALAKIYGVSRQTFTTWLKPFRKDIGERKGNYFTVAQVEIIFQKLSLPDTENELKEAA